MTEAELEEIAKRAEAATEGPWRWNEPHAALTAGDGSPIESAIIWPDNAVRNGVGTTWSQRLGACGVRTEPDAEANAAFVAHARSDVPRLVEEVRRLRENVAVLLDDRDDLLSDATKTPAKTCPHVPPEALVAECPKCRGEESFSGRWVFRVRLPGEAEPDEVTSPGRGK